MSKLQIISYNILADYLNDHNFVKVSKKYLDNDYRIKLLSKKLKKILKKTSIVCLQEVGPTQLSFLFTLFDKHNYSCISFKDLAIFYPNKFQVISSEVNFIKSLSKKYLKGKDKLIEKISKLNHAYIILKLKIKNSNSITICTTHLVSNPKYNNTMKTLQAYLIAKKLEKFNKVVFCGDFNSMPDSNVYKLLSTGKAKYPYYGNLKIKNNFISSYKTLYGEEKNITTHATNLITPKFTATIDYIWLYNLKPIKSYKIVTNEEISKIKNNFLPNKIEPSDHYLLMIVIKY